MVGGIHCKGVEGFINEYASGPPEIVLTPQGEGARKGRLWIRNIGKGLLIAGDIEGGPPDFPRDKDSLLAKDHVEIWLTAGVDPVLPPIGWGHQFGENTLADGADSCADAPSGFIAGGPASLPRVGLAAVPTLLSAPLPAPVASRA